MLWIIARGKRLETCLLAWNWPIPIKTLPAMLHDSVQTDTPWHEEKTREGGGVRKQFVPAEPTPSARPSDEKTKIGGLKHLPEWMDRFGDHSAVHPSTGRVGVVIRRSRRR